MVWHKGGLRPPFSVAGGAKRAIVIDDVQLFEGHDSTEFDFTVRLSNPSTSEGRNSIGAPPGPGPTGRTKAPAPASNPERPAERKKGGATEATPPQYRVLAVDLQSRPDFRTCREGSKVSLHLQGDTA